MRRFLSLGLLCLMLLGTAVSAQAQSSSSTPDDQAALALLTALDVDSYRDKGEAITAILQSDDERAREKERRMQGGPSKPREKQVRDVIVPEAITVGELAKRMGEKGADLVKELFNLP